MANRCKFQLLILLVLALGTPSSTLGLGGSKTPFIGDNKLGGFWGFLGFDAGWSWLKSDVSGEANKQGLDGSVAALITYYRKYTLFEIGGRYNYRMISGSRSGQNISVESQSVAGEFGIRLRFGEQLSIGPFFQYQFGSDLSFRPADNPVLSSEENQRSSMVAGLQWIFETRRGPTPMRLGLRLQRHLNVQNRVYYGFALTYQVGFRITDGPKPAFFYNTSK